MKSQSILFAIRKGLREGFIVALVSDIAMPLTVELVGAVDTLFRKIEYPFFILSLSGVFAGFFVITFVFSLIPSLCEGIFLEVLTFKGASEKAGMLAILVLSGSTSLFLWYFVFYKTTGLLDLGNYWKWWIGCFIFWILHSGLFYYTHMKIE